MSGKINERENHSVVVRKNCLGEWQASCSCLSGTSRVSWGIRTRHGLSQAWLRVAHGAGCPIPTVGTDWNLNPGFAILSLAALEWVLPLQASPVLPLKWNSRPAQLPGQL